MIDCTLVTCAHVPALDPDDRALARELRSRGLCVSIELWNDPRVDWSASAFCLVRSTWDYHAHYPQFLAWIDAVAAVSEICNERTLLRWNAHKSYLRDLESHGVPIVPTAWAARGEPFDIATAARERGWREIVIKPALGAASHAVLRVRPSMDSLMAGQAHLECLVREQEVLVQPYLDGVATYGERGLIFFDGRYSHAVVKKPFDTVLAIEDAREALVEATAGEIAAARRALEAVPGRPLYARVDLLRDAHDRPAVNEVELIEPGLYLTAHPPAAAAFADAIERHIAETTRSVS